MNRMLNIFVMILAVCVMARAVAAPSAVLTVESIVNVAGPIVRVGEVATVVCDDELLRQRIEGVVLGNAPAPGASRRIEAWTIAAALEQAGIPACEVAWGGSAAASVVLATRRIDGATLAEAARQWLIERLSGDAELMVRLLELPRDCLVPARLDDLTLTCRAVGEPGALGRAQVYVDVCGEGRLWLSVPVAFSVQIFRMVAVAEQEIAAGVPISAGMVRLERRDVATLRQRPVCSMDEINGRVAACPIPAGTILTVRHLSTPVAIRVGEVVTLSVKRGALVVSARGVARQDGRPGEVIRLLNIDSRRELLGRVIDGKTVEVVY